MSAQNIATSLIFFYYKSTFCEICQPKGNKRISCLSFFVLFIFPDMQMQVKKYFSSKYELSEIKKK